MIKIFGNTFFYEQTKVDEELSLSTLVVNQQETKLQKNEQGVLIQKIANLVGTGEDKVSYKIAMDRLNRRQLEEVGTARTREKPLNIIDKKLEEIEQEKIELQKYQEKKYETEIKEKNFSKKIAELEEEIKALQEIKILIDEQKWEKQKISVKEDLKKQNSEKLKEIYSRLDDFKKENKDILEFKEKEKNIDNQKKYWKSLILITVIIFILNCILQPIFWNNVFANLSILFLSIFSLAIATIVIINKQKKYMKKIKQKNEKLKKYEILKEKQKLLEDEIRILEKNNQDIDIEMEQQEKELNEKILEKRQQIFGKYSNIPREKILAFDQNECNEQKMNLNTLILEKNSIENNLEKLAKMEEVYADLNEEKKEIKKLDMAICTAKSVLEECYETMRHTVTPKFTQNLSNIISNITGNKYNNIRFNDEDGLIVENEKGEYVKADKLSVGTIEQLYLSLRLSMVDELSTEQLPIILDETFAYFDEERLDNFLKYIYKEYSNRQILIFTCTDREKNIMNKNHLPYNYIEL